MGVSASMGGKKGTPADPRESISAASHTSSCELPWKENFVTFSVSGALRIIVFQYWDMTVFLLEIGNSCILSPQEHMKNMENLHFSFVNVR